MELYRKHRAETLDDIYANETAIKSLRNIIGKVPADRPHTFLFVGPAGCGKTTLAYIVAKAFGVKDIIEKNSADYRGIDSSRELAENLQYMPINGTQAYILEEAHKITMDGQEALLKPTENCPEHTYLFFTTTDASKINAALKTRMVIIQVELLMPEDLGKLIQSVSMKEKLTLEDDVVQHIIKSAYGSPRRALTMLENVIGLPHEDQLLVAGYAEEAEAAAIDLCRVLVKKEEWLVIAAILANLSVEPEAVRRSVLGYLRAIMLKKDSPKAYLIAKHFTENYYASGKAGLAISCYEAWMDVRSTEV